MANNPYDQFDKVSSTVTDLGVAFGIGSNQLLRLAGDLYGLAADDMDNAVSRQATENIEYLQRRKSPELVEAERTRKKATDLEKDELGKALTFFRETVKNPLLAGTASAEAVPSLVGAGGAGAATRVAAGKLLARKGVEKGTDLATKAGVAAAVGTGAAMQGTSTAGEQYRTLVDLLNKMPDEQAAQLPQIKRLMEEKEASLPEAKAALALDLARSTGILSALTSAATQMVPGGRTIEKTLVGGPTKRVLSRATGAAKGAAGEALQEATEEGSGTIIQNIMAEPVEPGREITKGLGESMAGAVIAAGPLGAAGGAAGAGGATQSPQPAPEVETTAGKSEETPASAATRERLTERPQADLTRSEEMSPEEFWASVNVRHANLMGGQPSPEDVEVAGGVAPAGADIDPEKAKQALDMGGKALAGWRESNPSAPENIVLIYDPEMLHNGYGVQGAYNRNNGGILINTAFVAPERIGAIVNHEWAHATLATVEGQQALAKFAEDALKRVNLGELQSRYGKKDPIVLLEEWIAQNQEQAPSVIREIVARIREWLAQFNIVDLNDGEVADIMLRTLRELESNKVQPDIDVTGIETEGQTPETAYSLAKDQGERGFWEDFGAPLIGEEEMTPADRGAVPEASVAQLRDQGFRSVDYRDNGSLHDIRTYPVFYKDGTGRWPLTESGLKQAHDSARKLEAVSWEYSRKGPEERYSLSEQPIAKGRDTVLARAAQGVKAGEVTPKEYNRMVDKRMPLEPFEEVPTPATDDEVLLGLGDLMAGNRRKRDLKANPEDIEGQQVEARLDIPAYESNNVWVVTLHQPREREGAAGTVLAYTPTAVLQNVTFSVNETAALNVAGGKRKSSFATMNGEYVPMTARSAYEMANEAKDSGDWVEVGMNPIRHSYFYDKSDQRPVVSAEEVIQVGGMVLARGVEYGEKGDYKYSLAQTKTPEFERWFGDSKVVDEDGNPLVVYHGTGKDFTTFSISPDGGAYFTVDKEEAQSYASERTHSSYGERLSPRVVEAYLRIKNPFDPDKNSLPGVSFGPGTWDWIEPHLRKIREAGYDGVRVKETPDTPDKWKDWVVFDPTQIKSATDNTGTFDPENPDIRYSLQKPERPASGIMASPSITDIDYSRAKRNLTSANQARFKSQVTDYAPEATVYDAVGDWADGAENSVAAIFEGSRSTEELEELAAKAGLAGDQKAVLWWTTDPKGKDAIHRVIWPKGVSMDDARQAMIDVGLENRTLIQTPDGIQGFVFDQGQQNINKIEELHEHSTEPALESESATGDFLGSWTSRTEGRRAYRRVLGSTPQTQAGDGGEGDRVERAGGEPEAGSEQPDIRYSLTGDAVGVRALEDAKTTKFKNQKGTAKYLGDLLKSEFPEGLDRMDPEAAEKLADLLDRELSLALTMPDNANAIGWYGREMEKVVEILRSPELNYELDNPVNRGVFNALLAITSNGQEVVDQFLKSAQLYEKWKKTGKIPSLGKWGGERNRAMAGQIKFLNQMLGLVGAEDTVRFLTSESSLREHLDNLYGMVAEARGLPEKATVAAKEAAIGKYLNAGMPTGELKDYNTVGAIVFGPKLGGGFFANLYGKFDRLTMDRWFMRTFHRLTGRLGFVDDRAIQGALDEARRDLGAVEYLVQTAAGAKKDAFDPVSKDRLSDSDLLAYIKSEGKKAFKNYREINAGLKENPEDASLLLQDTLRRTYNRIIKAESGLFDAPDNGSHRVFIRDVLNRVQQQRAQRGEKHIDTSDIQAILWYLEKDIWDKLKDKKEKAQDELDEQDEDDDDSAGRVSYSNGAVELYRRKTGKDYVFKSGNQPERAQVLASD